MRRRFVLPALLFASLTATPMVRAADPLPSMEELEKMLDAKDFAGVLTGTSRVLSLRGPATASYHRSQVWMLKGEALLNSSQFSPASQAFESAAKEKDATDDDKDTALATAMLLKKSDRKGYQPKATKADPSPQVYDVLDKGKRKDAFAALFKEESADLPSRVDKLSAILNPDPYITLVKKIAELRPLERAAEGSTSVLDEQEKTLGHNYAMKIAVWSDTDMKRLDELSKISQQMVIERYTDVKGLPRTRSVPQGLSTQQQGEVRDMQKQAKNYAQGEQSIEAAMSSAGKDAITPAQKSIQTVYDQSQSVLQAALMPR